MNIKQYVTTNTISICVTQRTYFHWHSRIVACVSICLLTFYVDPVAIPE